ncbi:hypothetical protein [Christiangramia forsetii]|uniref:Uncharacterized protein n=2 Tax=Christiangramia forsetii TaxID=411153 RepID=A0LZS0_CHRFK|nr:hypothetical protein [Christiangramia forsetii]GGG46563.1 hypothetical protein GCM10011532_33070 [Christiangramia forsetii]CAL65865.1 hypothetical protein GFO_0891 [Christiangramia forsetii KT0803]
MGLFNLFGSKKSNSSSHNDENIKSEFKNFNTDYYLEKSEVVGIQEMGEIDLYHMETPLEGNFLKAFDTVLFKVGKENDEFLKTETNKIKIGSVTFYKKDDLIPAIDMEYVVNQIANLCNAKDEYWSDVDEMRINEGFWRGRNLLCDKKIFIELDDEQGFKLDILGWNEFITRIAST